MTTAHRPTYKAAIGSSAEYGNWSSGGVTSRQMQARDMPGNLKLKYRDISGADEKVAVRGDTNANSQPKGSDLEGGREAARAKADAAEAAESRDKANQEARAMRGKRLLPAPAMLENGGGKAAGPIAPLLLRDTEVSTKAEMRGRGFDDDDDVDDDDGAGDGGGARKKPKPKGGGMDDDDDDGNASSDLDSSDDDDDDDDSEAEEEALRRELDKIKAEREAERLRKEAEAAVEEDAAREEAARTSNPLLNQQGGGGGTAAVKRKWNDDVVFRNQARDVAEKDEKRFINDTIRNDFHRRFLAKYVQ